jgi:CRP/FNR family transcriptional regulator
MDTAPVYDRPRAPRAPDAAAAYPGAPRAPGKDASMQLQQARAHVRALVRALARSRQESRAARRDIETLTKANALLQDLSVQRTPAAAKLHGAVACNELVVDDPSLWTSLEAALPQAEQLMTKRIRFRRGELLYRPGDAFDALYAIRSGSCKTVLLATGGQEQVIGYYMAGEVIGMDGIGAKSHGCRATALEDMDVCPLPFDRIDDLAQRSDQFRNNLHKLVAQECLRAQTLMLVLGTMSADQRLAVFLLDLSQRYYVRGYSACEFVLRMTRQDIGSYLGLKLETVSRVLSRFQRDGLIQVQGRIVKLLDRVAVGRLVDDDTRREAVAGCSR